jgi:hypothetical protein
VQVVWSSRRGSRSIEHIGSAADEAALAALKAAAAQRLAAGQAELDLGVTTQSASEPLPIISSRAAHALQAAGLSFILGARIPFLPDVVREWRDEHPDEAVPDQLVLTQPWPASSSEKTRGIPDRVVHYQYRHYRARRTLRGIDEQVAKAQRAVDGHAAVKRNRFIKLTGATKSANRELEVKTRALAGWKGYSLGRNPVHRGPHRLVHKEVRPHCPPLPHRPDPRRPARPHRRRPAPARPPRNPRPHQVTQPPAGSQIHVQATVPATSVSTNPATMIATRA